MRNVFITGGSRGIGKEMVKAFCKDGATVAFSYHSDSDSSRIVEMECSNDTGKVKGFLMNAADAETAKKTIKEVKSFLNNRIDVLINSAGVKKDKSLMMMKEAEWDLVLDTNLKGCFNMTKLFIVDFIKQKSGFIINMTSVSGIKGMVGQTNYSASKAGIIGFTRSLARELMPYGITVNAVAPGFVDTEMVNSMGERKVTEIIKEIPAGRLGRVEEVVDLVKYIASDRAKYMTGQVIVVDGGLSV